MDTTPVNTTRLRSAKSIDFLDQNLEQTGWRKFFFAGRFVPDSGEKISFAGRFVPGEKNFFESVLTSNTKDHMEWYPLGRSIAERSTARTVA